MPRRLTFRPPAPRCPARSARHQTALLGVYSRPGGKMRMTQVRQRPRCIAAVVLAGALLPLAVLAAHAQTAAVVGQVTDARSAEGVAGVSVEVQGTRLGGITRADGRYRVAGI